MRGWKESGGIKSIPVAYFRVLKVDNVQKGDDKKSYFNHFLYLEGKEPSVKKYSIAVE